MLRCKIPSIAAATCVLAIGFLGTVRGDDGGSRPSSVYVLEPGCSTCTNATVTASGGKTCRPGLMGGVTLRHQPQGVYLSPNSCFGHFQTQWRKWEEVCPTPHIVVLPSADKEVQKKPNGSIPEPRLVDPTKMKDSKLPPPPSPPPSMPIPIPTSRIN
jgi:hypothetical protein